MSAIQQFEYKLKTLYKDFFNELNIDTATGKVHNHHVKFPTYPYIGSKYGITKKKILFVGLDLGADEMEGIQSFEKRRNAIEEGKIKELNPHIAGTYVTTLFLLKEEKNWEESWESIKNLKSCQIALREGYDALPKENPLSFIALTNYYKFVTCDRQNRASGKDRKHLDKKREDKLFFNEIKILNPDIIVFQSTRFKNNKRVIDFLKKENKNYHIGPHPSYRGKREPEHLMSLYGSCKDS